jgi:hypothetical protein
MAMGQNRLAQLTGPSHHGMARGWSRVLEHTGEGWWQFSVVAILGAGKGRGSPSAALNGDGSSRRGYDGGVMDKEPGRSCRRVADQRGVGCVLQEAAPRWFGTVCGRSMRRPWRWMA